MVDTSKAFQFGSPEDFQLQQAVNYLEGKPVQKTVLRAAAKAAGSSEATGGGTAAKK